MHLRHASFRCFEGPLAGVPMEDQMMIVRMAAFLGFAVLAAAAVSPAQALTTSECSAKYQAAKTAGSLNGATWNDFRKTQCAATATPAAAAAPVAAAPVAAPPTTSKKAASKKATTPVAAAEEPSAANTENAPEPAASTIAAPAGVVFPKAVSAKYASESPGKARMHTCLDQYKANKANNDLGGLTWIKAGGGYYSLCNTRLKG